jgi:hygromycin-B 7''-O-kinase
MLPAQIDSAGLDALHDDLPAWLAAIESIAREYDAGPVQQQETGSALVARVGDALVVKVYAPFQRSDFEFESAVLRMLHGKLSLPTPRLVATGERDGWPYLVMTQLAGDPLTATWPNMSEPQRLQLLRTLGALTAEVHALPAEPVLKLAPRFADFIAQQRQRCGARQQRTGLPAHLLRRLDAFIAGPLPECEAVLLTGEYTPMNLFTRDGVLAAMFDFGDGLVGPREYDWLGPLCFLAAGSAERCAAFMAGTGTELTAPLRLQLLRLLLLHRYSNLRGQLALPGWQEVPDFETLAERLWPVQSPQPRQPPRP